MEPLHGGSSRILSILQLFFKISLEVMFHQTILQNKHGVQHMSCFEEFKHSSSCISKCNSFYLIIWGGVMSFLTIWVRVSWFICCQEWGILNPSISSLELSCVMFHLKAFPKGGCYLRCLPMTQVLHLSSRWIKLLVSLFISIQFFFPWVAGCQLIIWDVFHKTISRLFFLLLVFPTTLF